MFVFLINSILLVNCPIKKNFQVGARFPSWRIYKRPKLDSVEELRLENDLRIYSVQEFSQNSQE